MKFKMCKKCSVVESWPHHVDNYLYQVVKGGPVHVKDGDLERYVCGIKFLDTDIKLQQNMKLLDAE